MGQCEALPQRWIGDIKGSNEKPHRVMLDEEEVEKQRQEILKAREEAEKLKEEHEKSGEPLKTELMNVDNTNNLWVKWLIC